MGSLVIIKDRRGTIEAGRNRWKKPLGPKDVVEALRERIKKDDLTLTASDAVRIILMLERLSQRCAEAYQVVGSLAGLAEVELDDPAVQKALDLFSRPTAARRCFAVRHAEGPAARDPQAPDQSKIVTEDREQERRA